MDDFNDMVGRLNRLKKQATAIHDIAEKFQDLRATGPKEVETLQRLTANLIDDLNAPAAEPLPPKRRPIR